MTTFINQTNFKGGVLIQLQPVKHVHDIEDHKFESNVNETSAVAISNEHESKHTHNYFEVGAVKHSLHYNYTRSVLFVNHLGR